MKSNRQLRSSVFAVVCALVVAGGAAAFARGRATGSLLARSGGQPVVKVMLAGAVVRDSQELALDQAGAVYPGETLSWRITSENSGDGAAREYKAVGQIPQGTLLIAGSTVADGQTNVTYSIDNGKNYAAQPLLEEQQADGSVKKVPAPVSLYTQVRYEWQDALTADGKLTAAYKVRVK